jgi:hypothetical protein
MLTQAPHKPISLYEQIRNGSARNSKQQQDFGNKHNIIYDKELSNRDHTVYHDPKNNTLLYNITGSRFTYKEGYRDWRNNLMIGLGAGKSTDRYNQEKHNLETARNKYNPKNVTITGYSQGGYHAQNLSKPTDKVITYNGAFVFDKIKDNNTHYRINTDLISSTAYGKQTNYNSIYGNQIRSPSTLVNFGIESVLAHKLNNIKDKPIYIN